MASNPGFRQQCPHCHVALLLRDPSWIGKLVECPKCKQRFVVEDPSKKTMPEEAPRPDKESLIRKDRESVRGAPTTAPAAGATVPPKGDSRTLPRPDGGS